MKNVHYNFNKEIEKHIQESISLKQKILDGYTEVINDIAEQIIWAYKQHKKVIWFGNGGSAADAQHLSCELVSKFCMNRKAIPSIALTTNTSALTAISNDFGYDKVFERQVEALAEKRDILIGITTSGKSKNVINALQVGKNKGAITVAFTGEYTEKIKNYADFLIAVPSRNTPYIQESHIMIGHIICYLVEKTLFGEKNEK
jgi:D-sedoheptulose 7-phosphate isomerase